jgi:hypothetical protein
MKYLLWIYTFSACWFLSPTYAHDYWADGKAVPNWVKRSCCGPTDVHHLRPDQVRKVSGDEAKKLRPHYANFVNSHLDYFVVDGYFRPIYANGPNVISSQDGDYWLFYNDGGKQCGDDDQPGSGGSSCYEQPQSDVYCFFVPMVF